MSDYIPVFIYFCLVVVVSLVTLGVSGLFPSITTAKDKFKPYESGIVTETKLLQERFPLRHYLVALIFLVFDVEVIFMYPWAVVAKQIGPFAFYEMLFFMLILVVGYAYVWKKGGLEWERQ